MSNTTKITPPILCEIINSTYDRVYLSSLLGTLHSREAFSETDEPQYVDQMSVKAVRLCVENRIEALDAPRKRKDDDDSSKYNSFSSTLK